MNNTNNPVIALPGQTEASFNTLNGNATPAVRAAIESPVSDLDPNDEETVTDFQSIPRIIVPTAQFAASATADNSQKYSKTDWN